MALDEFDVDHCPPYYATSHAWSEQIFRLRVEQWMDSLGAKAMYKIQRTVRFPWISYCWIDTLCIKQDDENDKLAQIPLMGEIYRKALAVVVVQDIAFKVSQSLLDEAIRDLRNQVRLDPRACTIQPPLNESFTMESRMAIIKVIEILSRLTVSSWGRRVWNMQEYILARNVIWIGRDLMPLVVEPDGLFACLANYLLYDLLPQGWSVKQHESIRDNTAVYDYMRNDSRNFNKNLHMVAITASHHASIEVDYIYAMMAIFDIKIAPQLGETAARAWIRWCELVIEHGHPEWLTLHPVAASRLQQPYSEVCACALPSFYARRPAFMHFSSIAHEVHCPPVVVDGVATISAQHIGQFRVIRKLPMVHTVGQNTYPLVTLFLFACGDSWVASQLLLACVSHGMMKLEDLEAESLANFLARNYDYTELHIVEERNNKEFPVGLSYGSAAERNAFLKWCNSKDDSWRGLVDDLRASVPYLLSFRPYHGFREIPFLAAMRETQTTFQNLTGFHVGSHRAQDGFMTFLLTEMSNAEIQLWRSDPNMDLKDITMHKAGVTMPIPFVASKMLLKDCPKDRISIRTSRCDVCKPIICLRTTDMAVESFGESKV